MKWLRFLGVLLAVLIALCGALMISGFGILFSVTDTTVPPPAGAEHGSIRTWRCHYVTAKGTFSFESMMEAYGDDVCYPVKRPTPSSWKFRRASFF